MTRYRSKKAEVEAFQWDRQEDAYLPEWVKKLWNDRIWENGLALHVDSPQGATVRCNQGDWIVLVNGNTLYALTDEEFKEKYEEISE